jgi:TatD DNase family protein
LRQLAQHPKVAAIGEIGLDYYWKKSPKETQHRALRLQLELAAELNLPVIIHNRESDADVVRLLAESSLVGRENPGVLHSFLAKPDMAREVLDLGFYLGFTGPITHDSSKLLHRLIGRMPLDRLVVETDAPYLAPKPHKGERNEPAFVVYMAQKMATLREMETAVLFQQTTNNAHRLFPKMNLSHE